MRQDPTTCHLEKANPKHTDVYKRETDKWEKIYHIKSKHKKAGVTY